jgi:hypothetical protein
MQLNMAGQGPHTTVDFKRILNTADVKRPYVNADLGEVSRLRMFCDS